MQTRRHPAFGGIAGETVRECLHPWSLLKLVPGLILFGLLGAGGMFLASLAGMPTPAQLLVALLCASPVFGRYALAARYGNDAILLWGGGVDVGKLVAFVGRYALLTLLWGVPAVFLLEHGLVKRLVPGDFNPIAPPAVPFVIAALLAIGVALVAATGTLVLATATDRLQDLARPERWRWLFHERRHDLVGLLTALCGGLLLCYLVILPFVLLVAVAVAHLSSYAAVVVALCGYLLPTAAAAIIAARLAGRLCRPAPAPATLSAPVTASGADATAMLAEQLGARAPAPLAPRSDAALATPCHAEPRMEAGHVRGGGLPGGDAMELIRAIQGLQRHGERDLQGAIDAGEAMFVENPRSAGVLAELAKLYRKAGRDDAAIDAASRAIRIAVNGGMSPVALAVFRSFHAHRKRLDLGAGVLGQLARILGEAGHEEDATWCRTAAREAQ